MSFIGSKLNLENNVIDPGYNLIICRKEKMSACFLADTESIRKILNSYPQALTTIVPPKVDAVDSPMVVSFAKL
ncbi:MAG: hypothetical protein MUO33_00465 [Sedimentisphaerales bacterium]|nr:hypothetical protein [Sedimentisphaerales bacterium]